MRKVLLVAGLAAVALSGCSSLGNYEEQANLVQLDSSTYRLSLYQPWMKQQLHDSVAADVSGTAGNQYVHSLPPSILTYLSTHFTTSQRQLQPFRGRIFLFHRFLLAISHGWRYNKQ